MTKTQIVLTGAPGVGKSTLIDELRRLGCSCVDEPAREIIAEQRETGGQGLWGTDTSLFLELLLSRSILRFKEGEGDRIFYDRGIPDCVAYAKLAGISFPAAEKAATMYRYSSRIFLLPPWAGIFTNDSERTLSFKATTDFHHELITVYQSLYYQVVEVPFATVEERAVSILGALSYSHS